MSVVTEPELLERIKPWERKTLRKFPRPWQQRALLRYYFARPGFVGITTRFYELLDRFVPRGGRILDVGAGPTNDATGHLAELGEVTGLDVDPAVRENRHCTRAVLYDGVHIPLPDARFDAAVSNYAFEHVTDPAGLCRELSRVLRPGGSLIFRTPNAWHYSTILARLIPDALHCGVIRWACNLPDQAHDPYPVLLRMNTRPRCRKMLRAAGFDVNVLECVESAPAYGMSMRLLFYPMLAWERIVNAGGALEDLRSVVICVARKPSD